MGIVGVFDICISLLFNHQITQIHRKDELVSHKEPGFSAVSQIHLVSILFPRLVQLTLKQIKCQVCLAPDVL